MLKDKIHKYKKLFIIIALAILTLAVFLILYKGQFSTPLQKGETESTTEHKGLDFTPAEESGKRIQLPIVSGLNMRAGELNQTVDFYNPNDNCYFVISIYLSDDTLIYKSDMLAPDDRINEIRLLQPLDRGVYRNCSLVYDCYALDGNTPLNGGTARIEITSK